MAVPIVQKSDRASNIAPLIPKPRPKAALWITTDGQEHFLTPSKVVDAQTRDTVTQDLAKATTIMAANIRALLTWPDRERVIAISMLARCKCAEYRLHREPDAFRNLLECMLAACPNSNDLAGFASWLAVAIEVVVITFPHGMEAPFNALLKSIKSAGIQGYTVPKLVKEGRAVLKSLQTAQRTVDVTSGPGVDVIWSDVSAIAVAGLKLPAKWRASTSGIEFENRNGAGCLARIIHVPRNETASGCI